MTNPDELAHANILDLQLQAVLDLQLQAGPYRYQSFGYDDIGLCPGPKVSLKLHAWGGVFPKDMTGLRVLDIGTNLGYFAFLCAQRGAQVVRATDVDEDRLHWARTFQRAARAAYPDHDWLERVQFLPAVPRDEYAGIGGYDLILLWSVYHHIYQAHPNHGVHFDRYREALRPGGKLLFEGPFDPDYIIRRIGLGDTWRRDTLEAYLTQFFPDAWRYVGPSLHVAGRECVVAWT